MPSPHSGLRIGRWIRLLNARQRKRIAFGQKTLFTLPCTSNALMPRGRCLVSAHQPWLSRSRYNRRQPCHLVLDRQPQRLRAVVFIRHYEIANFWVKRTAEPQVLFTSELQNASSHQSPAADYPWSLGQNRLAQHCPFMVLFWQERGDLHVIERHTSS
jgi:hypothetical protein